MRGRLLAAVTILVIAIMVIWEKRRMVSTLPPVIPQVTPPVLPPVPLPVAHVPPPAPVKKPTPKKPVKPLKKAAAPEKVSVPIQPKSLVAPPPVTPPIQTPPAYVPTAPPPPGPQEWKGNTDTAIQHEGQIVVQNDHQWIRFWAEHHPDEVAPDVDFSNHIVVGVFLGQRPSDGFAAEITGIHLLKDAVMVDYIERAPPPGTFQIGVTAFPYDIKVIPRTGLKVKFSKVAAVYKPQVFPNKSKP